MKTRALRSYLCFTLLATAFLLGLADCDKEESEPLRIGDDSFNNIENGVWTAYYPNTNQTSITIYGGVKPYTVSSNSDILKVNMDKLSDAFNYETLGVGDAEVTITDAKGESVGLKVKIDYWSDKMKIVKLDAYVKGDKMTVAAQKELKEKALASIPVKAGGGYQFIYTKDQGGIVYVYPDKYGEKYKEGTFTRSSLAVGNSSYRKYEIKLDGMERTYIVQRYYPSKTRSVAMVPYGFYEDLLDQFTDDYPEVESVYTMQVVSAVF